MSNATWVKFRDHAHWAGRNGHGLQATERCNGAVVGTGESSGGLRILAARARACAVRLRESLAAAELSRTACTSDMGASRG